MHVSTANPRAARVNPDVQPRRDTVWKRFVSHLTTRKALTAEGPPAYSRELVFVQGGSSVGRQGFGPSWRLAWKLAIVLCAWFTGASAHAQTGAGDLVAPQQQAQKLDPTQMAALGQIQRKGISPFTLNGMLEFGVGQGSFVPNRYARNPYVAWAASVVPAYYPIPQVTLSVSAKLAQEVTNSDVDNEKQQPIFYDMQLRARYAPGPIPVIGVISTVEARLILPTSKVSQFESLILGAQGRVLLMRDAGPVVFAYVGSYRKNFHRYTSPVVDSDGPRIYSRAGGAEDLRGPNVAVPGNNVSFAFSNVLQVSYVPIGSFAISIYYGLSNARTYRGYPKDEYSSPHATSGRGRRDAGFGGLDFWYRIDQRFSLSAGAYTTATPRTEDNKSFRFPFYDFQSTANNLTLFYLSLTVTEFLGG